MITEKDGFVPPRRRQIEIENKKIEEEVKTGNIVIPEAKLDNKWRLAECSNKDRAQLKTLGIPIT